MIIQDHLVTMEVLRAIGFLLNARQIDDIYISLLEFARKLRLGVEFGILPVVCKCKRRPSVDGCA